MLFSIPVVIFIQQHRLYSYILTIYLKKYCLNENCRSYRADWKKAEHPCLLSLNCSSYVLTFVHILREFEGWLVVH
jgi:hypothetical protein